MFLNMPKSRTREQGLKSVNASTHDVLLYIRPDADAAALVNMLMPGGGKKISQFWSLGVTF